MRFPPDGREQECMNPICGRRASNDLSRPVYGFGLTQRTETASGKIHEVIQIHPLPRRVNKCMALDENRPEGVLADTRNC